MDEPNQQDKIAGFCAHGNFSGSCGACAERTAAWEQKLQQVDLIEDAQGEKIDPGIKKIVAALNILGFPTSNSCDGHLEKGHQMVPWVTISDPDEPDERFVGENNNYKRVAEKYGLPWENVKNNRAWEAYSEAVNSFEAKEETLEFQKWKERQLKLREQLSELLKNFYYGHRVAADIQLIIPEGGVSFFLRNNSELWDINYGNLNETEKAEAQGKLQAYREEINRFADFLKQKYFQS